MSDNIYKYSWNYWCFETNCSADQEAGNERPLVFRVSGATLD